MNSYIVTPHEGIGSLKLGMSPEEILAAVHLLKMRIYTLWTATLPLIKIEAGHFTVTWPLSAASAVTSAGASG